ncbi:hypothetical protein [Stenotrophomonas sp. PD6]|uniref:hypothetical protein n=1 Tax=Stenotrophomonas sp. PD6 TaxID=3368612 RepID=UPI003BA26330
MHAAEASSHKTVQNPGTSEGDAVDKNDVGVTTKIIHRLPHPLGGSSAEGFKAEIAFIYKYLDVFSRNSGSTITTKLLIYSTSF